MARAERKTNRSRESKKARMNFTESPFKFTNMVFSEKTSVALKIPLEELEEALSFTYSDPDRDIQVVQAVVRIARAKAAGAPNGITYAVYNNCQELTK